MLNESEIKTRVLRHIILLFQGKTIRQISEITGWSKTVVQQDLTYRADLLFPQNSEKIKKILSLNYNMRGFHGVNSRNLQYKDTKKLNYYQKIFNDFFEKI